MVENEEQDIMSIEKCSGAPLTQALFILSTSEYFMQAKVKRVITMMTLFLYPN